MTPRPPSYMARILVAPLAQCVAHEGVVPRWVDQIAANLLNEGVMKNPMVVTTPHRGGKRIVIDGMHRFAALRKLEISHAVVYEIDYASPDVALGGWDALTLRPLRVQEFLIRLFAERGYQLKSSVSIAAAQQAVDQRRAVLAAYDGRRVYTLNPKKKATVEECVVVSQQLDAALDADGYRPLYVADTLAISDYHQTGAKSLFIRPHYTKAEIIARTLTGKIFPRKSTRHIIPGRPLRVDIGLPLLRAKISLAAKNRLLQEHLQWCYEADRVRYYPESVLIFAD